MDNQGPINEQPWEEIEQFLLHRMSPEEEARFRERLAIDAALNKATDEARVLLLGIQESALSEKLDHFHTTLKAPAKVRSIRVWLAAASVAGLVFLAAWLLFWNKDRHQQLFAEYFQADPGLISAMSTSADYQFDRGMIDYKTGQYDAAIRLWEPLQATRSGSDTLHYFLASAYLANDNPGKAIPFFEKVITSPNSPFQKDAYWYTGLAYLKQGDKEKAIANIEKAEHPNKDTLLKKLKD